MRVAAHAACQRNAEGQSAHIHQCKSVEESLAPGHDFLRSSGCRLPAPVKLIRRNFYLLE